ncbi:MAG: metallophosphoesterase [Desulfurococcales archaeon]|nr:metallophosphoesterase [Desulfurococcales archaeon]
MLIGVISDTHDVLSYVEKASKIFNDVNVEFIIHLGDYIAPFTLRLLASKVNARIIGILGNNDGEKLGLLNIASNYNVDLVEQPRSLDLAGRRLLLVHGFGSPQDTRELVYALAESRRWDAILYGHTHEPDISYKRGTLILNPGNAGGLLYKPSIALLDTDRMAARLIEL